MKNVFIKQSTTIFTGITQTAIDPTNANYSCYTVPLEIRNTKYPQEFRDLPDEQINFPLIDDEVPLHLGDKIDYKDYIKFTDLKGNEHFAIVNPVPRKVIEENNKYKVIGQVENGQILPPPYKNSEGIKTQIPKIVLNVNSLSEENPIFANLNTHISIPIVSPLESIGHKYKMKDTTIPIDTEVNFQLVQYQGIFKDEIKFAAVNLSKKLSLR